MFEHLFSYRIFAPFDYTPLRGTCHPRRTEHNIQRCAQGFRFEYKEYQSSRNMEGSVPPIGAHGCNIPLMCKRQAQTDIKYPRYTRTEDGPPIASFLLQIGSHLIGFQICQWIITCRRRDHSSRLRWRRRRGRNANGRIRNWWSATSTGAVVH